MPPPSALRQHRAVLACSAVAFIVYVRRRIRAYRVHRYLPCANFSPFEPLGPISSKTNLNDDFLSAKIMEEKINNFVWLEIGFIRNAFVCTVAVAVLVRLVLVNYFPLRKTRIILLSAAHRVRNSFRHVLRQLRRSRCPVFLLLATLLFDFR